MSVLSDLLAKAQKVEAGLKAEGTTVVGEVEADVKDLVENLQHQVDKETSDTQGSEEKAADGEGVQKSSDLNG